MNFLPSYSFIDSTDVVGFLGKPSHLRQLHETLWPNQANRIGLEIISTPQALKEIISHPSLSTHVAGFHARTQIYTSPKHHLLWFANHGLATPHHLLQLSETLPHSYVLMHNTGYSQLIHAQLFDALRVQANRTVLVVENDAHPGALSEAVDINHLLGGKNLVIDWLHYHQETRIPFPQYWPLLLSQLTQLGSQTAAWHICVGTRDNLPEIPLSVLRAAAHLKATYDIRVIIEHQFKGRGLIHNHLNPSSSSVQHLLKQYDLLISSGLISLN